MIYLLDAGIFEGRNLIGEIWHTPDILEALFNYRATSATLAAGGRKHKVHPLKHGLEESGNRGIGGHIPHYWSYARVSNSAVVFTGRRLR
jgi:hypothetical protein